MKNVVRNSIALICCSALVFLASCEKENLDETETVITDPQGNGGDDVFCDELENGNPNYTSGFVGAECWTAANEEGIISEDCECVASESSDFDCPELEANFQDDCSTQEIMEGFVNENCECQEWASQFDCPELFANVGELCYVEVGVIGVVTEDCECVFEEVELDCPGLGNVGDPCQGGWGVVTEDCNCEEEGEGFTCPETTNLASWYELEFPDGVILQVGDECYDVNNNLGTVSDNCECIAD